MFASCFGPWLNRSPASHILHESPTRLHRSKKNICQNTKHNIVLSQDTQTWFTLTIFLIKHICLDFVRAVSVCNFAFHCMHRGATNFRCKFPAKIIIAHRYNAAANFATHCYQKHKVFLCLAKKWNEMQIQCNANKTNIFCNMVFNSCICE